MSIQSAYVIAEHIVILKHRTAWCSLFLCGRNVNKLFFVNYYFGSDHWLCLFTVFCAHCM